MPIDFRTATMSHVEWENYLKHIPSDAMYGETQLKDLASKPFVGRTDFATWDRGTLEKFARTCADENKALREELAFALAAWRKEVLRDPPQAVSSGTPS